MSIAGLNQYNPVAYSQTKTESFSLENLVEMTVINLARGAGKTVREYLNGYALSVLVDRIKKYAQSEKDVNAIIFLTINHADNLILKYSREGQQLTFDDLIKIKRNNPEASIIAVFTYALAKNNPKLEQFADSVFDQKQDIKCQAMDNPLIGASPISRQVQFIDVKSLKPADVYTQSNLVEAEETKYRQQQLEKQLAEAKKANHAKLANMQVALRTDQVQQDDVKRQEYRTNFLIRA
jgi:hypothetical protein